MASKQKSAVFEYFALTSDFKHYVCQCPCIKSKDDGVICNVKISGSGGGTSKGHTPTRASNLKRHLERYHPDIFKRVQEKDKASSAKATASTSGKQPAIASLSNFFISDKVTVTMTPDEFKRNIVRIIALNGISLRFFSRPEVSALIGELARKLSVSLDKENIKKIVFAEFEREKEELKRKLKNKFVYLKMDACTRHRVNYFAINVRYVDKGRYITKTLAIKDTDAQHSSAFLKQLVKDVLHDYGIEKSHVLCIVTDNASNMLSMVKKLNEEPSVIEECATGRSTCIREDQPGSSSEPLTFSDLTEEQDDFLKAMTMSQVV